MKKGAKENGGGRESGKGVCAGTWIRTDRDVLTLYGVSERRVVPAASTLKTKR